LKILFLLNFLLLSNAFSNTSYESLKFEKINFNRDDIEISGLVRLDNQLLFVGDKLSNRSIYKIIFENKRFYYKSHIDLSSLKNHNKYFIGALLFKHGGRVIKSAFDLEGITSCGSDFYLANEQTRHILKVNNEVLTRLPLDFTQIFKEFGYPLSKVSTNAGFEGVTIDCENQILYIAQERQPRAIIVVDLKTMKITDMFATKTQIQDEKVSSDYADLYFENGFLYMLERNAYLITKYDVKAKKIVSRYSFKDLGKLSLDQLYNTGEPYGLAEGLVMSNESIYIGIDNNKKPLSKIGEKTYEIEGNPSSIITFNRPKGF